MEHDSQGELAPLIQSPEFTRLVQRFESSTGQRLQVFDLQGKPLTPVEDYPRYCRLLQERKACPLYFDPEFLRRPSEGMAVCCAGVGHFVAPIRDEKEEQVGAVVSPAVKFAPNAVEPLAELAFKLKVFPDELIQAADAVQAVDAEKLLGAGELAAVGLNLLAEMQARERVGHALRRLQSQIAESNSQMLAQHLVEAALYLTRGDYGLVLLLDDNGSDLASGFDQPVPDHLVEAKRRLTAGIAEWVRHADRTVTVPDVGKSAWCRYLTDDEVQVGSIIGVPIPVAATGATYGAIVVGWDRPREDLNEPMSLLSDFIGEGLYAIVMGRKLIQAEQLALLDTQSGAYSARYLEELLDREISRAARFNHPLAIVLVEVDGYEVLRGKYGEAGLARVLRELVALVRAKTRKVNTFARIQDGRFCLVIPEAAREVAVTLGQRLKQAIEEHPFSATAEGEILRLAVDAGVAASEAGRDDRATMLAQAEQSLEQARAERRRDAFRINP
ncbi:MAG TPA: diguanylate cyclase [Candidatus Limnocylindrales bacterium]|nr:diguanylate cyclase [Candidatus Limnocylindrales bacterium]